MTRHLLALPGRPDTSAAERVEHDKHHAARFLTTVIERGDERGLHLADVLLGAHPLHPIYTVPPAEVEPRPTVWQRVRPLVLIALVVSVAFCWWAVQK